MHVQNVLFSPLNLLFGGILAVIAVVVFVRSIKSFGRSTEFSFPTNKAPEINPSVAREIQSAWSKQNPAQQRF